MKRDVLYRAPCGRTLRTIDELDEYLHVTQSRLTVDLFSFDEKIQTDKEFVSVKVTIGSLLVRLALTL